MRALQARLARHRVAVYCLITFAITWAFWFATVYPQALPALLGGGDPLAPDATPSPFITLAVAAGMLFPALGVVVTRLLTGEGFRSTWIKPQNLRRTGKYYVIGWFGPLLLVAVGAVAYFALFPADFDPAMPAFREALDAQLAAAGQPPLPDDQITAIAWAQLALVLAAPALNAVTCFGEEWGWRGYLLPHLLEKRSMGFTLIVGGVIWGLWHAPITALGHNYGLGYVGWPFTGILAMVCFTTVIGCFFSWLTLRAKSCLPAVLAHGALNGCAAAPTLFALASSPFVGPASTGIIGGIGFIAAGALCFVALRRKEPRP